VSLVRDQDGLTLVELLVAAVLLVVVLTAAVRPLNAFERQSRTSNQRNDAQARARQTMDRMARELRNVAGQTQFIEKATSSDLVFQTVDPLNGPSGTNNADVERVRYCLDSSNASNGVLWKQTQTWTSTSPPTLPSTTSCPDSAWPTQRVVAENVMNGSRAVWTYNTSTLTDITWIHIDLYVDVSNSTRPGESQLSSGVYLRNQNKAPTASFTATATGNKHVQLNGAASSDPEGGGLSFAWFDGSTQIGTGQTCDCIALATGNRTIMLQVTDQSGLATTATKTVNVL
jgi:prepilin-type N-terminal cleavage/methylation domain-containing protein